MTRSMTHNERVLELLSDGRPHTHHELYGLHVVAHSRVSDLRKQGFDIRQWRDGDSYLYLLVKPDGATSGSMSENSTVASLRASLALAVDEPAAAHSAPIAAAAGPLTLFEAA